MVTSLVDLQVLLDSEFALAEVALKVQLVAVCCLKVEVKKKLIFLSF